MKGGVNVELNPDCLCDILVEINKNDFISSISDEIRSKYSKEEIKYVISTIGNNSLAEKNISWAGGKDFGGYSFGPLTSSGQKVLSKLLSMRG